MTIKRPLIITSALLPALLLAAATASASAAPASSAPARQGVGVQLLDTGAAGAPAYGRSDVYIGAQDDGLLPAPMKAGTARTYTVRISNPGGITEDIRIFPAAASMTASGYVPSNNGVNAASSWTGVSQSSVTLAPGGTALVAVTVRIPAAARAGTGYAIAWAAVVPPGGSGNVTLAVRAGIREYLTVLPATTRP
jgi:hypothetical protein